MRFKARIQVRAKKGLAEPEAETVKKALVDLNFQVFQVRTGKEYELVLEAASKKDAEALARTMCSRLLVNPVKDDYVLEVEPVGSSSTTKP